MRDDTIGEHGEQPLFLVGVFAPAGLYRNVDTGQRLVLEQDGALPGRLDGRIACYIRIRDTWGQTLSLRSATHEATRI